MTVFLSVIFFYNGKTTLHIACRLDGYGMPTIV